jgi:hypothetical protein
MVMVSPRYIRINTIPGFSNVRNYYWFDSSMIQVISLAKFNDNYFDPNATSFSGSMTPDQIGSRTSGEVRYNFVTITNGIKTATLRLILIRLTQQERELDEATTQSTAVQPPAAAKELKYAVVRLPCATMVARDLSETCARLFIEKRIKSGGDYEYLLVQQVAIAKPTNSVAWV